MYCTETHPVPSCSCLNHLGNCWVPSPKLALLNQCLSFHKKQNTSISPMGFGSPHISFSHFSTTYFYVRRRGASSRALESVPNAVVHVCHAELSHCIIPHVSPPSVLHFLADSLPTMLAVKSLHNGEWTIGASAPPGCVERHKFSVQD